MAPSVLFVSKPIAPTYHDGTKCLVRDVALHLSSVNPVVMSVAGAPPLEQWQGLSSCFGAAPVAKRVEMVPIYSAAGGFAPSLMDNMKAASWVAWHARASLWHFVFAPNRRTSTMGRWLKNWRRVPVVQTIASAPREFADLNRLLFGDVVVAQSEWTRVQLYRAYDAARITESKRKRIEVIPPPLGPLRARDPDEHRRIRAELQVSQHAPLFVFPGDLETGGGVSRIERAIGAVSRQLPEAAFVLAYREKSERTRLAAARWSRVLAEAPVRLAGEVSDVLALVSGCSAVLFPVDDLWGKVDLPIVLLEAMALGVPVVVLDHGPLHELQGVVRVSEAPAELAAAAIRLESDATYRASVVEQQSSAIDRLYRAEHIARAYEALYLELLSGGGTGPGGDSKRPRRNVGPQVA